MAAADAGFGSRLAARARAAARRAAAISGLHVGRRANYDLVPRTYYSPVPDLERLPGEVWSRRSELRGIALDTEAQLGWAERELGPFVAELDAPRQSERPGEFFLENTTYESVDAEVAYAMVRRSKPRRVIELGSGWSTFVLARACERNAADGSPAEFTAFNPYPPRILKGRAPAGLTEQRMTPAQDVPAEEFTSLADGDVLFVDTTHAVRLGGDVNHIVLDVLPLLRPGVLVHFHDIWLPFEYSRELVQNMQRYWTEQYLLQAFLAFNDRFAVVFAAQAIARDQPGRLRALVPSYEGRNAPTSFWIRRTS